MTKKNTYILIMAGGIGSRFWPSSRSEKPKQFLDILGLGKSLLQLSVERFRKAFPLSAVRILTHERYKSLVQEQLPELAEEQIICEPSRKNTAPCIAYAACKLYALDPESSFIVAPSDHIIMKEDAFLEKIQEALKWADKGYILTLGIEPSRPDTGYGYIRYQELEGQGAHPVERFTEKPGLEQAKAFLADGSYLWNAGIFIWKTARIMEALKEHAPAIYKPLSSDMSCYNNDKEQEYIKRVYAQCPSISIDYALMERAEGIYTVPADIGWSDLGTWASLYEQLPKDKDGNALDVQAAQQSILSESKNCLLRLPKNKIAVVKGLENYIIVDEGDVLLIYPKDEEQEIKQVQADVAERFGLE